MGRQSRAKRERRAQADYVAALTASEGTWLEHAPDAEEQARIAAARKQLEQHRAVAATLTANEEELHRFSLDVFRDERFAPLHFDDWVIESIIEQFGEPPVVEDPSDTTFSDYLRAAALSIANSRVRRALADQVRRFLPRYVEEGQVKQALAIEHNAYMMVMSNVITPLLVQMLVGGLARWYEEHEEDTDDKVTK